MSCSKNAELITVEKSALVLIDIQERLMPVIDGRDLVLANAAKLLKFANIVGLPVVVTEQDKLGSTLEPLRDDLAGVGVVSKITFDCFGESSFTDALSGLGDRTNLIVAGVEAHICVAQTVLSALAKYNVQVIADAVSSRNPLNKEVALNRMGKAGAVVSSTEMVIYELLKQAGTDEFKATLKLVK